MKKIQIDGIWYGLVPMGSIEEEPEISLTFLHSCQIETDNYVFEAIRLCRNESPDDFFDGIDIKFTDKRQKPWTDDVWDNNSWMNAVIDGNEEAITNALQSMDYEGLLSFTAFLKKLREIGWLTK